MDESVNGRCPECDATVPAEGTCRQNFHALLLLEGQVPGAPGAIPHFYAVATYVLQHPESMRFTAESIADLREGVRQALAGTAGIEGLRQRARTLSASRGRVTRRAGDEVPVRCVAAWTMTVADVLGGGPEDYAANVEAWAHATTVDLDGCDAGA